MSIEKLCDSIEEMLVDCSDEVISTIDRLLDSLIESDFLDNSIKQRITDEISRRNEEAFQEFMKSIS